ncbi:interaptin [Stomoxys calcitrans]|uniref:interaptin n=1 Tax=Stomoxys calcitrans TaxID=35570 RepID=UPI0027E27BF6|nr:interaptin [Stomoxys calcitrans]
MENEMEDTLGLHRPRERTLSNMSQQSSQSLKMSFPLMTSDSGLYTCSSNNSDITIESDSDSWNVSSSSAKDKKQLELAMRDVKRLRSELERLTKSEHWYKQELRQQKSTRLEDLERIYTQERKYMQENQRLQKECLRVYEKCTELENELQRHHQATKENIGDDTPIVNDELTQFEMQQQSALINDQQQLISVLRKQKKTLLNDLKTLTEEKDDKVVELQKHLADLELDNKRITKKCTNLSKERSQLAHNLEDTGTKLSLALDEKLNLQKSVISLREQLEIQAQLVKMKENEITQLQVDFRDTLKHEDNLDKVHSLSLKYQEDINSKSLEIIELKNQLSYMQEELENLQQLQAQNDEQQRHIEQLKFSLEACQLELQGIKKSELLKSEQIQELQQKTEMLLQENDERHKQLLRQRRDFDNACQELKTTKEQYSIVNERYKETQFKLELLEIEQSKLSFQNKNDQEEIKRLRLKLSEYLHQTSELVEKMQTLEAELKKVVDENVVLKCEFETIRVELRPSKTENKLNSRDSTEFNNDFRQLSKEFERLQNILDEHSALMETQPLQQECLKFPDVPISNDDEYLTNQCKKLRENTDLLQSILKEKQNCIHGLNTSRFQPNSVHEQLLNENESLKKQIFAIESEATSLKIKQDIIDKTQRYNEMESLLCRQEAKEKDLLRKLLANDSKLYKLEKQLNEFHETDALVQELQMENRLLKCSLEEERLLKADLNTQLIQIKCQVETMKETLEQYNCKQKITFHKAVQCDDFEEKEDVYLQVDQLKKQIDELQQKQSQYAEIELHKSNERLQLLQKLSDLQSSKMQSLQESQNDWEDMLRAINTVQNLEEETRRELELKRMELEELNHVFAEQNEELKKLEEFTAYLEFKRQQEREQLKETFQKEISVMKGQLNDYQQEVENQQEVNRQLQQRNDRIQENYDEDYAMEIANYRKEVRSLKAQVLRTTNEKDDMLERIKELENELHTIKHSQREAIVMPHFAIDEDSNSTEVNSNMSILKTSGFDEDHLRILTKVLEAEYARKMQRYDEHIHSLLTNVKALKKSLRNNEEKTAILGEEQSRANEELKDLHTTKRNLEEMRFKYEQSQSTIQKLRRELSLERKRFESSDMGKSSQNDMSNYEVANLIDDYKKLIRQSALATKRPSNNTIHDLIQRSSKCVPNFKNLETNIGGLRCDLQNFLSMYAQKMPSSSLITAASLTVPPSLMDELRAASEGF